ncbi:MAG: DegT/DnrJ/EryC1/StrS family aminotransferase [Gammaproteobacteria bacterium]|nr:DegT/DnrJ/EryC1/StrS family aminotransferase [Gammaproteobacteria bacterium]
MRLPRYIAPAGTPIPFTTLMSAGIDQLRGQDTGEALAAAIQERYGVRHCLTLSSGRAALTLIFRTLKTLANDPRRNEVIVPGYTCYSVAASAILAGLRLRIVDIDPQTLSYDQELLAGVDCSCVLAIISANLYGLPNDLDAIEQLAQTRGIYMIDDAAQAMHATFRGRNVGTFGDVGIYSFDKGKNITSLQGGAIVTRDDGIAKALATAIRELPGEAPVTTAAAFVKLAVYTLLLRPWLYWIPANIPALGLGRTVYTTDIPLHRSSSMATGLVLRLLGRIDAITAARVQAAARVADALTGIDTVSVISPLPGSVPVYLRLPCLAADADQRDGLIDSLVHAGIGATQSFPCALGDLVEIADHSTVERDVMRGARDVATRMITLPTLAYLRDTDIRRLAAALPTTRSQAI